VLSEAQNSFAKDRLLKSAVREISLAVHATFSIFEIKYVFRGSQEPSLTPLNPPLDYEQLNVFK